MESKTRQVMDIREDGKHFKCVYNAADKYNPYRVYKIVWELSKDGYGMREHKKLIAKYGDFRSVLCLLKTEY